jgi:hypothetical protein
MVFPKKIIALLEVTTIINAQGSDRQRQQKLKISYRIMTPFPTIQQMGCLIKEPLTDVLSEITALHGTRNWVLNSTHFGGCAGKRADFVSSTYNITSSHRTVSVYLTTPFDNYTGYIVERL